MLSVDLVDSARYGFGFEGQDANRELAEFQFDPQGTALSLDYTAFDIDFDDEVSVSINGTFLGHLDRTPNNSTRDSSIEIPLAAQISGTNTLVFTQRVSGYLWGVTDLTLSEISSSTLPPPPTSIPLLSMDVVDSARYGFGFEGQDANRDLAEFQFDSQGTALSLAYTAFDIDFDDEVSVSVNGTFLGHLDRTPNNATRDSSIEIPLAAQISGTNTLVFTQRVSGYLWGVTDLTLTPIGLVPTNEPPRALAGDDFSLFVGETRSIDGSTSDDPDGLIVAWSWTDPDGTVHSDAPDFDFTPAVIGTQTIVLTVTDDDGATSSDSLVVLVTEAPSPDNDGPELTIDGLVADAVVPELGSITGSATDSSNIDTVELVLQDLNTGQYWDGANYYPAFRPDYTAIRADLSGPNDARTWSHDFDFAIDGDYRLTVLARDGDGNVTDPSPTLDFSIASSQSVGNQPDLSRYQMSFEDEFDGTELDPTLWRTSYYWGPYQRINGERQLYVDTLGVNAGFEHDPFELSGGTLRITATPVGGSVQPPEQPDIDDPIWSTGRNGFRPDFGFKFNYDAANVTHLSGVLTSIDRFDSAYGYFEIKAKVPHGRGLWPAFWLLTTKYVEDVPEIDIMENLGQRPDVMQHMYHYFEPKEGWRKTSTPEDPSANADLSEGFHTYGAAWEPGQIVWYVDGVERRRITSSNYSIAKQAMYLLTNLAVGGVWPGEPDNPDNANVFPATLEIDYIRAYERAPPAKITPAVLQNDFELVFSDEFNGGAPNASKWRTSYPWGPFAPDQDEDQSFDEEQYYIDWRGMDETASQQPFSADGGILSITAEPITPENLPPHPVHTDPVWQEQRFKSYSRSPFYDTDFPNRPLYVEGNWVPKYTSGVITSRDAFQFVNGYVEIRAKFPEGAGLWPALRLLKGYNVGATPEIDIATIRGEDPTTLHHSHSYGLGGGARVKFSETTTGAGGQSFSDDFHVYGLEWHRGVIKWYVDGDVVATYENDNVSAQLMYIEANLGVGGDFVGTVDPNLFPATMQIDYVRAYKHKDIH